MVNRYARFQYSPLYIIHACSTSCVNPTNRAYDNVNKIIYIIVGSIECVCVYPLFLSTAAKKQDADVMDFDSYSFEESCQCVTPLA